MMGSVNISASESGMGVSATHPLANRKCSIGAAITGMMCIASIMMNIRVCYISLFSQSRSTRSVAILVAHLSCLSIGITVVNCFSLLEMCWAQISVGTGICEMSSFFRNTVFGMFPWNVAIIIWKSNEATKTRYGTGRLIGQLWFLAGLLNIPTALMVRSGMDPVASSRRKCIQIPLLGDYVVTLTYELLRFVANHVVVVMYLMHEVFIIRSKLRYLHIREPLPGVRMRRQVQRIRSICVHCVLFTLLWLPSGMLVLLYKIRRRSGLTANPFTSWAKMMIPANTIFFMTIPAIYLFLNEEIALLHFLVGRRLHRMLECGGNRDQPNLFNISASLPAERREIVRRHSTFHNCCEAPSQAYDFHPGSENARGDAGNLGTSGMSRISTVGKSVSLSSISYHVTPGEPQFPRDMSVLSSQSKQLDAGEHNFQFKETHV